jgi:hypothetical protein
MGGCVSQLDADWSGFLACQTPDMALKSCHVASGPEDASSLAPSAPASTAAPPPAPPVPLDELMPDELASVEPDPDGSTHTPALHTRSPLQSLSDWHGPPAGSSLLQAAAMEAHRTRMEALFTIG